MNWYNADITSSTTTAVHKSSIASSLELPDNNGGERLAVNVGAKKIYFEFNTGSYS